MLRTLSKHAWHTHKTRQGCETKYLRLLLKLRKVFLIYAAYYSLLIIKINKGRLFVGIIFWNDVMRINTIQGIYGVTYLQLEPFSSYH